MAMRYPGGLIATSPVNAAYPSGVWTQSQTIPYASQNVWQRDQYWRNTTLLLHGDGTNGAQNNTFLDSSSNNFTITRNGNTTQGAFTPYQQNGYWSNYFDGSGDYCLTSSTQVIPTGSFTVEAWVYPLGTGNSAIVAQGTSGNSGRFSLGIESGLWFLQIGDSTVNTGTPASNQWIYVAATFNGSTLTLYVNGTSIGTVSTSNNAQNTTLRIGTLGPSDWANYYWNGYISNLRISNTVRTVTSIPTSPFTNDGNTTFLSCQSNRFVDNSTTPKTLTIYGNTAVQAFQPFPGPTTWSASVLGGSGYFDGTGDYLALANTSAIVLGSGNWTFDFWFYPDVGAVGKHIASKFSSGSGPWQILYEYSGLSRTKNIRFIVTDSASTQFEAETSTNSVPLNSWTHFAAVRNGNTVTLYVNGVADGSFSITTAILNRNDTVELGIRSWSPLGPIKGHLSDFRIVVGTAVYTSNFTPPTAPLTAITNTQLLCSFTNGGIFDNAQMNDLETVGNAQISTSVVKYGTGSMYFDGNGDTLPAPDSPNCAFGTGSFTIEFWAYSVDTGSLSSGILDTRSSAGSGTGLFIAPDGTANYRIGYGLSPYTLLSVSGRINNQWQHVAFVRNGSTLMIFIDGVLRGSTSNSTNFSDQKLRISGFVDTQASPYAFNGYLDDLRITKGVARYISNFTPPIARMPNQ